MIEVKNATKHITAEIKDMKKMMKAENLALAKGIRIAMSEANVKKGTGSKPKAGSKRASKGDWIEGPTLPVVYRFWDKTGTKMVEHTLKSDNWEKELKARYKLPMTGKKDKKTGRYKTKWHKFSKIITAPTGHQKHAQEIVAHEMFRKGSQGPLPYSWGGKGLANYYLRKQWLYALKNEYESEIKISPAKFKGDNNNEKVLKLIDEGGTTQGSRRLGGYKLIINPMLDMKTLKVGIIKWYKKERPIISIKPFHIKDKTVARIGRLLRRGVKPSTITNEHWRKLGRS